MENKTVLLRIQYRLMLMSYDCYTADAFMTGLVQGHGQLALKQVSIDMIYRFFVCGLIKPGHLSEFDFIKDKEEIESFIQALARENPFSSDMDDFEHWYTWDLCCTERSKEIVEKYHLRTSDSNELNPEFAEEITALFLKHNVGLDVSPLVILDVKQT